MVSAIATQWSVTLGGMAVAPEAFDSVGRMLFSENTETLEELAYCCAVTAGAQCERTAPAVEASDLMEQSGWVDPPCWFCPAHALFVAANRDLIWNLPPTRFVCRHSAHHPPPE